MATLHEAITSKVRPWLDMIDQLRSLGIEQDISIPQIAVMGDQSSGKSSVLEALSGVPFPRGAGLVTKCAIELRMKRLRLSHSDDADHDGVSESWRAKVSLSWDREQPTESGVVTSPEALGYKINKLTEALLLARGNGATFEAEHSIQVELVSPNVPDLTIIDLPGIVRTNVDGQSKSVIGDVDALLNKYLKQDRTIVLAVIPSNVDVATVDILERAEKVDPAGVRTIGVMTKPDQISKGEEGERVDVLTGVRKPLKLGYVMVKNRSQAQISEGMTLAEAKEEEARYFASHEKFCKLRPSLFGVDNLARRLTTILVSRIRDVLPDMIKQVGRQYEQTITELEEKGEGPPSTESDAKQKLIQIVQEIHGTIKRATSGTYDDKLFVEDSSLRLLALIRKGPQVEFQNAINSLEPSFEINELQVQISDMRGRELLGFPRFETFELLTKTYVLSWEKPSLALLLATKEIVSDICAKVVQLHAANYEALASDILRVSQERVNMRVEQAKTDTLRLLDRELQPFTLNHYFMDTYNKIRVAAFNESLEEIISTCAAPQAGTIRTDTLRPQMTEWYRQRYTIGDASNEVREAENMQALLKAYWLTSTKRFIDEVNMVVYQAVFRTLAEDIQAHLLRSIDGRQDVLHLFGEGDLAREQRMQLESKKERLASARQILHGRSQEP